ncbi:MAG: MmcQ/YjbR family DNA-binding protein [Anaerolineales bacterium]
MLTQGHLIARCAAYKGATETYPFDDTALVFKVMGKMFALIPTAVPADEPPKITLKCDPTLAQALRATYEAVQPGYYMNKEHWNTVTCDETIPAEEVLAWIDDSYALVVKGLRKADREALAALPD